MISALQIGWLVGLYEGEGWAGFVPDAGVGGGSLVVEVGTTDSDIAERFANLVGKSTVLRQRALRNPNHKDMYRVRMTGARAAGFLMTVYSQLGERRKQQAADALAPWRLLPARPDVVWTNLAKVEEVRSRYHPGVTGRLPDAPAGRARIERAKQIIRELGAETVSARLGGVVEQAAPHGSAAEDLLGPQGEVVRPGLSAWDVSMCEKWAVEKIGVTLEQYRAYLVRTYGSATELDGMMLWDQKDALLNAARDGFLRSGLVQSIMAASRRP